MPAISAHPAGEVKTPPHYPAGTWPLDTPGGRFYAEWDDKSPVTREGQLIFFFQFLHAGGRWAAFLRDCPLQYTGNRGSGAINVMGTVLLSVLSGHWRYAHINSLRGDGINPGLLSMSGTVSEDAVRKAMGRIEEAAGLDWGGTKGRRNKGTGPLSTLVIYRHYRWPAVVRLRADRIFSRKSVEHPLLSGAIIDRTH